MASAAGEEHDENGLGPEDVIGSEAEDEEFDDETRTEASEASEMQDTGYEEEEDHHERAMVGRERLTPGTGYDSDVCYGGMPRMGQRKGETSTRSMWSVRTRPSEEGAIRKC